MKTLRYKCVDCGTMMATSRKRCPICHDKHVHEKICRKCGKSFTRINNQTLCAECRHESYMVNLKVDNAKVINTVKRNPCATLQQVADKYGLSRERINQIILKAGITKIDRRFRIEYHVCLNCGDKIESAHNTKFCNEQCEYEYHNPLIECHNCHTLFRKPLGELIYWGNHKQGNGKIKEHIFCGKHCKGVYIGEHYGLKAHPENHPPRKYNYESIYSLSDDGFNTIQISKNLSIPYHRVYTILKNRKSEVTN